MSKRRQWHPTPVLLLGKSHGQRSLVGCSPWDLEESEATEQLHFHFSLSCIGEGDGNPLQCSCLENPRDGGAWWAAVYGVAQSRTQLKQLSSSIAMSWYLSLSDLLHSVWQSLGPSMLLQMAFDCSFCSQRCKEEGSFCCFFPYCYKPFSLWLKWLPGDLKDRYSFSHHFYFSPFGAKTLKTRTLKNNCIYGEN